LHLPKFKLPDGVGYQVQTLWGSIGWATPATLGVALAALDRRAVLVTGDGAHQLTATEIGVMGRYKINPIIFVLNNGLYGVEDVLSEVGHVYDDIAKWDYHRIPEAMGCKDWFTAKVSTVSELDAVFAQLNSETRATYIEIMIPAEESQPLSRDIISRVYKADLQS
jgi:indolepyruvate decarboxylase